jgi:hypothetical protein
LLINKLVVSDPPLYAVLMSGYCFVPFDYFFLLLSTAIRAAGIFKRKFPLIIWKWVSGPGQDHFEPESHSGIFQPFGPLIDIGIGNLRKFNRTL